MRYRRLGSRTAVSIDTPDPLEKGEQRRVIRLYETVGCEWVSFSQPRATMQTEGIPDLKIYCRRKGLTWWQECKCRVYEP